LNDGEESLCDDQWSRSGISLQTEERGLIGFEQVTASHFVAPADTFATAALDDGYGNRIPCYEVHTIGAISDRFRTETGFLFQAQHTLSAARN